MSISSQLTAQSFSAAMTFLNQNICFGIYLFIYLFIYSLTYLFIYLFVCLFIYLSVHVSVLFICLLYLFIYLLIYINHLVTVQGLNKALVHALAIALKNERSPQPEQVQHLPGVQGHNSTNRNIIVTAGGICPVHHVSGWGLGVLHWAWAFTCHALPDQAYEARDDLVQMPARNGVPRRWSSMLCQHM